jgi:hypothetical protein
MRIVGACAGAMEILSQTNYNGAAESNKLNYAERRERRCAAKRAINRPAALCYYCRSAFANLFPLYCSARSLWNGAHKKTATPIAYLHYF